MISPGPQPISYSEALEEIETLRSMLHEVLQNNDRWRRSHGVLAGFTLLLGAVCLLGWVMWWIK